MSKYHAIPTEVDGIRFDSRGEARRYQELKLLQAAGEISHLGVHPSWELVVNGVKIGKYTADFEYREGKEYVVEDYKGVRTRDYVLRKKLMLALHKIDVREVKR